MAMEELTSTEAAVFAQRLNAFAEILPWKEQAFLETILSKLASPGLQEGWDNGGRRSSVAELVVLIHRTHLVEDPFSLNPQPLPRDRRDGSQLDINH